MLLLVLLFDFLLLWLLDGVLGRLAFGPGVTGVVERVATDEAEAVDATVVLLFDFLADDDGLVIRLRERELIACCDFFHR